MTDEERRRLAATAPPLPPVKTIARWFFERGGCDVTGAMFEQAWRKWCAENGVPS